MRWRLHLADMLAHPVTRDVLRQYKSIPAIRGKFTNRLLEVVEPKYNRHDYEGRVQGYGRVILT